MPPEVTEEYLLKASILLSAEDYQAIGGAVTNLSWLESTLAHVNLANDIGVGVRLTEELHRDKFRAIVKKSFRKRADLVVQQVLIKTGSEENKIHVEETLETFIHWRDFLCHGTFKRLPDGRLHCCFWDRKSFDIDTGPLTKTFSRSELLQLATSALEMSQWLIDEFGILSKSSGSFDL
jgi:hypothetical protein